MFSTSATGILALYLAVMYQTFGRSPGAGTPFGSGLKFSTPPERNKWKSAVLVAGVELAFVGGGTLALTKSAEMLVGAALAFMGILVGVPQVLWALRMCAGDWASSHRDAVLNGAFVAPVVAAVVAALAIAL